MRLPILITTLLIHVCAPRTIASDTSLEDDSIARRTRQAKIDLWLHGAFSFSPDIHDVDASAIAADFEMQAANAPIRLGPIREVRRRLKRSLQYDGWYPLMDYILSVRGGDDSMEGEHTSRIEKRLAELSAEFGKPFVDAIEKNKAEQKADCERSCELFFCANESTTIPWDPKMHMNTSFCHTSSVDSLSLTVDLLSSKATEIDPNMGGAWINMGTTLAESGDLESADPMFLKAIVCCDDVKTKGMINLAVLLHKKANNLAASGDLNGAKLSIDDAAKMVDDAKPLLDIKMELGGSSPEDAVFAEQIKPLRIQIYRLCGQILVGMGDLVGCEAEFRTASERFGDIPGIWDALARVWDLQGKSKEANQTRQKLMEIRNSQS